MQQKEKEPSEVEKGRNALNNYVRYSAMGFQMIAIIGIFTFIGYKIDENRQSETPIITALFSLGGVCIALYQVVRSINKKKTALTHSRFLILFILLTFISGTAAYLTEKFAGPGVLIPKFWVIFGFIAVITAIAYFVSYRGIKKRNESSIHILMAAIIIKLLFCMALVLVYLLKFRVNSVYFAAEFFSLYFLFTAFEVYCLLCNLRDQNKT